MLQKIHDKVSGWFAGFLLALLAVVFVFWGIDFGFGGVNYAAKVNGEKIDTDLVRRAYQNQLNQFQQIYRSDLPEQMRKGLQEELLEQFIRNELLLTRATDLGYGVSTEQVMDSYERLPAFQMDGKYNKELAERLLRSQGISPAAFVEDQRRAMQATQLQK